MQLTVQGYKSGIALTVLAAIITIASTTVLSLYFLDSIGNAIQGGGYGSYIELSMFYGPVYVLIFGNCVYLLARFGFFQRLLSYRPAPRSEIEKAYDKISSELIILIPSYNEEEDVIRQTLISAALVEFPRRRVVLLIDNPPFSSNSADESRLASARRLPDEIRTLFSLPAEEFEAAHSEFCARARAGTVDTARETRELASLYDRAACWLETWADNLRRDRRALLSHTDALFTDKILLAPARAHRERACELMRASLDAHDGFEREYRRLASLFRLELSSFERKRYVNLSHAPNKAMNLNSYLALLGGNFREVSKSDGLHLEQCEEIEAELRVPNAQYVINLDADSLIIADYALRLLHVMEQPGNQRIGLAQTPYLAIPNSPLLVQRIAGATTDLHYIIQQGVNHSNAAFWVGPNALIRKSALDDIAFEIEERGYSIKVFIRERTVIEDTDATVDLITKGWQLYNYMSPMAYSATPPDFGTLIIQRQRWANGGLLILPNLIRHLSTEPLSWLKLREGILRVYSLVSACCTGLSMLILIFFSFDDKVVTMWLPLSAIPYYVLLSRDLVLMGYRVSELPRVYALQLLLVPVLVGGTLQSLQQALTGQKAPFIRTPKISGRTATALRYLLIIYFVLIFSVVAIVSNTLDGHYYHAVLSFIVFASYFYGVGRFMGFRASFEDLFVELRAGPRWKTWTAKLALSQLHEQRLISPVRNIRSEPATKKSGRGR